MPLQNYFVRCCTPICTNEAVYKIASHWSDGITSELKTYALCCPKCLECSFHFSRQKQAACRTAAGETLDPPGIYRLQRGQRDQRLDRLTHLEQELLKKKEAK